MPVSEVAEIADVFARNEIATSNEIRQLLGWKPHDDPKADELRNSNMPQPADPSTDPLAKLKEINQLKRDGSDPSPSGSVE
jgi:hypothetical protein